MAIAELASDLARALDPVRLAEQAGISADARQADMLRSAASRVPLLCSRQAGKSTVTGIPAVHCALYQPASLVLLLAPTLRQSGELFKKCLSVYQALGRPVPPESESALQLALENGSRIVSLLGKEGTIRGYSGARLSLLAKPAPSRYVARQLIRVGLARQIPIPGLLRCSETPVLPGGRGTWWIKRS